MKNKDLNYCMYVNVLTLNMNIINRNRYMINSVHRFCNISYFKDRLAKTIHCSDLNFDDGYCTLAKSYNELFNNYHNKNIFDIIRSTSSQSNNDTLQLKTDFHDMLPNIIRIIIEL